MTNPTPQQLAAIKTTHCSVCINANAGTGKTTVLIDRIIHLIMSQHVPLKNILVITFTDKAAQEIRERLSTAMQKASLPYWEINSAAIGTFHSFCGQIIKEQALRIGRDPSGRILNEIESTLLCEQAVQKTQEQRMNNDDPIILELLCSFSPEQLRESVVQAIKELSAAALSPATIHYDQDQTLKKLDTLVFSQQQSIYAQLTQDVHSLQNLQTTKTLEEKRQELVSLCTRSFSIENLKQVTTYIKEIRTGSKPKDLGDYIEIADLIKKMKAYCKEQDHVLQYAPEKEIEHIKATLRFIDFTRDAWQKYTDLKKDALDYDDLQTIALQILQDHDITKEYQNRFNYVMVDEFQDTNTVQNELIKKLAKKDNLCIVGDWKQSIYLFRQAQVRLFMEYIANYQEPKNGVVINLTENFRSLPNLLNFTNAVCQHIFKPHDGPAYEPLIAGRSETGGNINITFTPQQENDRASIVRDKELRKLVNDISILHQHGTPLAEIAILLRNFNSLRTLTDLLEQAGLNFVTYGGRGYYQRQEIADIIHYLKILDNPLDELSLIGVLRSSFVGLQDQTLLILRHNELPIIRSIQKRLYTALPLSNSEIIKIQQFYQTYREHALCLGKIPISELLSQILERSYFKQLLLTEKNCERAHANVQRLVEIIKNFSGAQTIRSTVRYLEELQERDAREETPSLETDALHILTIHKSKGLQFGHVFLPDLYAHGTTQDREVFRFSRHLHEEGLVPGLKYRTESENKESSQESFLFRLIKAEHQQQVLSESKRLLYVALTRAKYSLSLYSSYNVDKELDEHCLEKINWGTWLKYLHEQGALTGLAVQENDQEIMLQALPETKNKKTWFLSEKITFQEIASETDAQLFQHLSVTDHCLQLIDTEKYILTKQIGFRELPTDQAPHSHFNKSSMSRIGNAVHEAIEKDLSIISSLPPLEQRYAQTCLDHYRHSALYAALQTAEHYHEPALQHQRPNILLDGRIDLVYKTDHWHIVDFKTAEYHEKNHQEYILQLNHYREMWAGLVQEDIKKITGTIYYLYENKLHPI